MLPSGSAAEGDGTLDELDHQLEGRRGELQGVWPADFPALRAWVGDTRKHAMFRDLAGNAFFTTLCTSVLIAVLLEITGAPEPQP